MTGRPERPGDGGFLSRWSRRKQQARDGRPEVEDLAEAAVTSAPRSAAVAAVPDAEAVDEEALSDEELLARYELPDPSTLTASDDVAAFMRSGVPKRLRNMALRQVWRLDPVLANLDGLNDYDEDYTDAAMLVGAAVKTAYQVGRGGAAHLQDAADRLAADRVAADRLVAETPPDVAEPAPLADAPAEAADGEPAGEVAREAAEEPAEPVAAESMPPEGRPTAATGSASARRRHMVFTTSDSA